MPNEVMYLLLLTLDVNWLRNRLSQVRDLRPLIWRICGHLSEGSAATYLEDLRPLIWRICGRLSEGSAATYLEDLRPLIWFNVEIRLTQPQVELEFGLSLAITRNLNLIWRRHFIYFNKRYEI